MPPNVESSVVILAWMLLGAALLSALAVWIRVPYAVALVVGGLLVEETHLVELPHLDPSLLLFVFLPPLLFDAAFRLDDRELRSVARSVLFLAVPGTIATAVLVAVVLALVLHFPFSVALLFGSIVAATDPVAVVAVFRALGVPGRLAVIAEGESLINDGVAITLYTIAVGLVAAGSADAPTAMLFFLRQVLGGVAIGLVMGVVFSRLSGIIDDHLIEMTLSTALAYGSYLIAQSVEASGALSCVAAGLVHGSYGRQVGMTERTRRLLDDLWEYLGFVANALVFLLVGFSANLASLAQNLTPVAVSVLAVLGSRAVVIFAPAAALPGRVLSQTTLAERTVLFWGGLRGALTITLALALPPQLEERQTLIAMAFGVVLFTLIVQGLSLSLVVRAAIKAPLLPATSDSD
jgi:CPA1 family monovalent cation:H+ antiporter